MRRSHRASVIATIGACLVAALSACSGLVERQAADPSPAPATADEATADPEGVDVPLDEGRVGGRETGFTIVLTDDWIEVDVDSGELVEAADAMEFAGNADFVRQAVEHLDGIPGVIYAFELGPQLHMMDEFVTNVNGFCFPVNFSPTMRQLALVSQAELEMVGADNVESSETTAGDTPALRVTYDLSAGDLQVRGLQYSFASTSGDMCQLTFTTNRQDDDLERFDGIVATLELA